MRLFLPLLALGAAGCGTRSADPPADFAGCDDAQCRRTWLLDHWKAQPDDVLRNLADLPDPTEQIVAVEALAEAFPGETRRICDLLPQGPAQERCTLLNERPHLWQIDVAAPDAGKEGSGKVFPALAPTVDGIDPWPDAGPLQAPCAPGSTPNACQTEGAWVAAEQGRILDAVRHCRLIDVGQWRYECQFQAAERAFDPSGRGRLSDAIVLCLGAGYYQSRCLGHITERLALLAPAATTPEPEAWGPLGRYADEARRALAPLDPGLSDRFVSDLWSRVMLRSYAASAVVTGDPLDAVEPFAVPHVRAAAAWRLMAQESDQDRTAEEWAARLDQALASRATTAEPLDVPLDIPIVDMWTDMRPGEEQIPWTTYLGDARRAIAPDPGADAILCLLEAAARDPRDHNRLFSTAYDHPDRLVRWTVARLAETQRHSPELINRMIVDDDPLVRARAMRDPGDGGGP